MLILSGFITPGMESRPNMDSIKINYLPLRELDPVFDYYTPVLIYQ